MEMTAPDCGTGVLAKTGHGGIGVGVGAGVDVVVGIVATVGDAGEAERPVLCKVELGTTWGWLHDESSSTSIPIDMTRFPLLLKVPPS
jgi:hypothetical protein